MIKLNTASKNTQQIRKGRELSQHNKGNLLTPTDNIILKDKKTEYLPPKIRNETGTSAFILLFNTVLKVLDRATRKKML